MKTAVAQIPKGLAEKVVKAIKPATVYWDQREELGSEYIQKIFSHPDGLLDIENELYDMNMDYISELEQESLNNAIMEFEDEFLELYEVEDIDEVMDEIRDELRDNYDAYPSIDMDINQLIRNTGDIVAFYSTGEDIGDDTFDEEERKEQVMEALGIDKEDEEATKEINQMVLEASYGGELVIYFHIDLKELSNLREAKSIEFNGYHVAIIDTMNGSGSDCFLKQKLSLPFSFDNLYNERSVSYNYTYDVCGMYSDWCKDTIWQWSDKEINRELPSSPQAAHMEEEQRLNETFKSGKCTFGDMNITRHRNTTYINNYPCGSKCEDCGTFWID